MNVLEKKKMIVSGFHHFSILVCHLDTIFLKSGIGIILDHKEKHDKKNEEMYDFFFFFTKYYSFKT